MYSSVVLSLHLDDEVLAAHPILDSSISGNDPATLLAAEPWVWGVPIGEDEVTVKPVLVLFCMLLDRKEVGTTMPSPVRHLTPTLLPHLFRGLIHSAVEVEGSELSVLGQALQLAEQEFQFLVAHRPRLVNVDRNGCRGLLPSTRHDHGVLLVQLVPGG